MTQWKRVMSLPMTCSWAGHAAPGAGKPRGGPVVGQGVEPDVRGLLLPVARRPRERDAPAEARPARGDVLEPLVEQPEDLVAAALRLDEFRVRRDVLTEELLVARQAEEPVALRHHLERARRVQHALPVDDLRGLLERLAAHAVQPRVRPLVEIVGIAREDPLDQLLHARLVRRRRWCG